jgi:hypothetical protein
VNGWCHGGRGEPRTKNRRRERPIGNGWNPGALLDVFGVDSYDISTGEWILYVFALATLVTLAGQPA